jgi:TRAP-type uncharacterized transport system fused permease subunit
LAGIAKISPAVALAGFAAAKLSSVAKATCWGSRTAGG